MWSARSSAINHSLEGSVISFTDLNHLIMPLFFVFLSIDMRDWCVLMWESACRQPIVWRKAKLVKLFLLAKSRHIQKEWSKNVHDKASTPKIGLENCTCTSYKKYFSFYLMTTKPWTISISWKSLDNLILISSNDNISLLY